MAAVRDPEATRARIFEAAVAEFARHGIAGARIDRIAAVIATGRTYKPERGKQLADFYRSMERGERHGAAPGRASGY